MYTPGKERRWRGRRARWTEEEEEGMFWENISLFAHGDGTVALTKNGSIVVLLRVSLNKLWPKNTSGLTGYCYSRINLFFIPFFVFFFVCAPEYSENCILYRKWKRDIRDGSKDAEARYVKFKCSERVKSFFRSPVFCSKIARSNTRSRKIDKKPSICTRSKAYYIARETKTI